VSFALEGFYRYGLGTYDLSLRARFTDLNRSLGNQILIGGDFRAQLLEYGEGMPLDGSLTVGLGGPIGDDPDLFRLPVGISLGRRFQVEGSETGEWRARRRASGGLGDIEGVGIGLAYIQ
jgi:hypothetical protein